MTTTIKVHGSTKQAAIKVRGLRNDLQNMTPALRVIGNSLADDIRGGFVAGETPWGDAWAPLKHRKGRPLRDTGRLMNSITHRVVDQGQAVEIGTNVVYANLQQFGAKKGAFGSNKRGSPIPWGDVPAREFMPIRKNGRATLPIQWRRQVDRYIEQHLEQ